MHSKIPFSTFSIITFLLSTFSLQSQDITGSWNGALDIQGIQLRIVLHVEQERDHYKGSLDSPDQAAFGIEVDTVTFHEGQLVFEIQNLGARYEGKLENGQIIGIFSQAGMNLPLTLSREEITPQEKPQRPQEPKAPFPYTSEEHVIPSLKDTTVQLAGTLLIPNSNDQNTLAIMISGSGPQNRDEELLGHKPFLVMADYLCRKGISVFRYDDRGVGESKGDFTSATSADFADDAEAIMEYFQSQKRYMQAKIGFIGHSEGGMIAPVIAARNENTDYIVLLAGPGTTLDTLLKTQSRLISEAEGLPKESVELNQKILAKTIAVIQNEQDLNDDELGLKIKKRIRVHFI